MTLSGRQVGFALRWDGMQTWLLVFSWNSIAEALRPIVKSWASSFHFRALSLGNHVALDNGPDFSVFSAMIIIYYFVGLMGGWNEMLV